MKLCRSRGFTLIEILISILLLGVSLVGISSVFSRSMNLINSLREQTVVAYALQEQMEILRGTSFSQIQTDIGADANFNAAGFAFLTNASGARSFSLVGGSPTLMLVTLTVTWTSARGTIESRSMETFITSGGISG